jgi:hypothetical protein
MIIQGSPEILNPPRGLNKFGSLSEYKSIEELYQFIIGRQVSGDPNSPFYDAGLKYFQDRFGSEISADEVAVFEQMAAAEVAAREAYFNNLEAERAEARRAGVAVTLRQQLDADGAIAIADAAAKKAIADAATEAQNTSQAAAAIAEMARADAANAKKIADIFNAKAQGVKDRAAAAAKAAAAATRTKANTTMNSGDAGGGINPVLILAVAAAAFFIGG